MIPLATTLISVLRLDDADEYAEPYQGTDETHRAVVAQHVRAVIDRPINTAAGSLDVAGGEQQTTIYSMVCDPVELDYRDLIRDEEHGRIFRIDWSITYTGDHTEVGLRDIQGEL